MVLSKDLLHVLRFGTLNDIRKILSYQPRLFRDHVELSMELPLHVVVREQRELSILRFTLRAFPNAIKVPDMHGQLPLHVAVQQRNWHIKGNGPIIVRELVRADPTTIGVPDWKDGYTPMHTAILYRCDPEIIQFLLHSCHGYNSTIKNANRRSQAGRLRRLPQPPRLDPCMVATMTGGYLPLHVAVFSKASVEIVQALVDACPKSLRIPDQRGFLPIHFAILSLSTTSDGSPEDGAERDSKIWSILGGDELAYGSSFMTKKQAKYQQSSNPPISQTTSKDGQCWVGMQKNGTENKIEIYSR
ncbi:predicted protein [Phaeodactylum tricornutum CCAP 1055/1]|uniref:Uncharacterized protein n=2 Tax=Phaeodactylum tricornutum TaxID=2850 RepID=B7GCQ1_PHATC|nr:predicted protein [Phaeodactylum tricornutum CCAP 1055/1]EEC43654.1 predicted protein [Phaeodactylum tricornutum CCAP 1055/1]|eukprot:XP_002184918.1 predicted protein [Phaeodactylum tricornutum CCAP 1055/1]